MIKPCKLWIQISNEQKVGSSTSGLVIEYIVAIDVTRVRFPAGTYFRAHEAHVHSQELILGVQELIFRPQELTRRLQEVIFDVQEAPRRLPVTLLRLPEAPEVQNR